MADNYLENQYERYLARKAAWEKAGKPKKKKKLHTNPAPVKQGEPETQPEELLHRFATSVAHLPLPEKFTCPFGYTPHPLCIQAAGEVQAYLAQQEAWQEELSRGKMFGVLVVRTPSGEIGYLAAFSGILAGSNRHPFFVPPVYDLLQPQGFFKQEEEQISQINLRIRQLETSPQYERLTARLSALRQTTATALADARRQLKEAKAKRDEQRSRIVPGSDEEQALIRESQFQKADYKRLKTAYEQQLAACEQEAAEYEAQLQTLKTERKNRSAALQQRLFGQFNLLSQRGETRNLCDIFAQTVHKTPPAGAGECAAPKLLQQAYLHGWQPLAMAEFWWGASPQTEVRHHGHYYPACKGKCEPILQHMLQGLDVEENPLHRQLQQPLPEPEIVYEDEWLVVLNKPAGMLSVPGKEDAVSVYDRMRLRYPDSDGPLIVHRIDMATSGLLVVAKTKRVHQHLQAQFKNREVKKRYIALLEGIIPQQEGIIELPLCPNPLDRPRQMVSYEHGKPARTTFRVLDRKESRTRIAFYPHTGRTHQLRVHAAHPLGLNCPIAGDELYGQKADRLYLHAETLEFKHPVTGEMMSLHKEADF